MSDLEKQPERATRILLAYNGSRLSQAALRALVERHRAQNAEVEVLYAEPVWSWDGPGSQVQRLINQAAQVLRSAGFKVKTLIMTGATSDAIIYAAAEWDADLIVLGWHGRAALRRFLFGSMADAVTHHVHCSVELVRDRTETSA
jgi:nucleotide-binding universal stress UspA family protein